MKHYQGLTTTQYEKLYNICKEKNLNLNEKIEEIEIFIEDETYDSVDEIINDIESL